MILMFLFISSGIINTIFHLTTLVKNQYELDRERFDLFLLKHIISYLFFFNTLLHQHKAFLQNKFPQIRILYKYVGGIFQVA